MKSVVMLPVEGGPSRTRDGSCVSSALLGDAHTHPHTLYMRMQCMFLCGMHACMHVCLCWQPRAGGFGGAGCVCVCRLGDRRITVCCFLLSIFQFIREFLYSKHSYKVSNFSV